MLKNYLLVAVRNFLKQKLYSTINVIGLASGLVCVIFIYLWVDDELSYNRYHADTNTVYQVLVNIKNDNVITWESTPGVMAEELGKNIPDIEHYVRLNNAGQQLIQYGEKGILETGCHGDESAFEVFHYPMVAGNMAHPVPDISSIAISQSLANRLFGNEDPIGKHIRLKTTYDLVVTAVFADAPAHSTVQFQYLVSYELYKKERGDGYNWGNFDHPLYLTFNQHSDPEEVKKKINAFIDGLDLSGDGKDRVDLYIQPFTERYLNASFENGVPTGGRVVYVRVFIIVAMFILVIACINFMNMATAKASSRSKEVGVRKVIGAQRTNLVMQFIAESILISLVAMIIAMATVYTLLPLFNLLVSKSIESAVLTSPVFITYALIAVVITGLLAGSYPAFFLSSYNPATVLKGTTYTSFSGASLRQILVVFQFTLTVILIASALVVYRQVQYIQNKNIGYNRESVVQFSARGGVSQRFDAFRQEVLKDPAIKNISRANQSFVEVQNQTSSVNWPGKPDNANIYFRAVVLDFGALETLEFRLAEGRLFQQDQHDTSNFILTKESVGIMGLKNPIGTTISLWGNEGKVVGVVEDFHSRSLTEHIDPIVFYCKPEWTGVVYAKINGNPQQALATLESTFKTFSPEYPFEYSYLDDTFNKFYSSERTIGKLALGFTALAIIISGLGLLGLAAYTAERRRKEISVRKILGASVSGLVSMIAKDFAVLSLIATTVGCPVAWYLMDTFLSGYQYHTEMSWDVFVITACSVVALSLLTVIGQVTRAALSNPVDSLRSE